MAHIEDREVQIQIEQTDTTADVKALFSRAFDQLEEELDLIDWKGLLLDTSFYNEGRVVKIGVRGLRYAD